MTHHLTGRTAAAFGGGIAVTVAAAITFQSLSVGAVDPDESTFSPITPCRLFDFRVNENVGLRSTPLGPDESHTVQVTGSEGNCTIPADATGVAMNVTSLNSTRLSFLTVWPSDAPMPLAASLNYRPGEAPTPNKVDVKLSASGSVDLYNERGTVDLVGDVVG